MHTRTTTGAAACTAAVVSLTGLTMQVSAGEPTLAVSLHADQSGSLVGPDETAFYGVGQTARFVLIAELGGTPFPAFFSFNADLIPFAACSSGDARVVSFAFADWAVTTTEPNFQGASLIGGAAASIALPGVIDPSSPLEICSFEVEFVGGPERLIYEAVGRGPGGEAFGVVGDATASFGPVVSFGPEVFASPRVIAVSGPGPGGPCTAADTASPYGVLDLADVLRFIQDFEQGRCGADLGPPWAVFDLGDVQAFVDSFVGGCL